jgi:hypothetical protein
VAAVYAWLGEADRAFQTLETAQESDIWDLKVDPFFQKLRAEPRWGTLLRKFKLPVD